MLEHEWASLTENQRETALMLCDRGPNTAHPNPLLLNLKFLTPHKAGNAPVSLSLSGVSDAYGWRQLLNIR